MRILLLITFLSASLISNAQPVFSGEDLSGVYQCDGQDHLEGLYKGKVTIKLVADKSSGEYGAYQFKLEVPGFGEYPGHAAAQGKKMAIYFANTDLATKDFGTGIANFSKKKPGNGYSKSSITNPNTKGVTLGPKPVPHNRTLISGTTSF